MQDVPKNMRISGMLFFRSGFLEALHGKTPMCVAHVAHAAEILLKARIAQEHPLLIFSKLPKANDDHALTLINLLENGRTFSYEELPNQLWAVTGIKIEHLEEYRNFGRLRNQVIHFSMANSKKLDLLTLDYSLKILDPLVESFWKKSVIDFIKNDPQYQLDVNSGFFEQNIRDRGISIDQRLRKLLGEDSEKAYKEIKVRDEYFKSKTEEDWELEYKLLLQQSEQEDEVFQKMREEEYQHIEEIHAYWKKFLDSF